MFYTATSFGRDRVIAAKPTTRGEPSEDHGVLVRMVACRLP